MKRLSIVVGARSWDPLLPGVSFHLHVELALLDSSLSCVHTNHGVHICVDILARTWVASVGIHVRRVDDCFTKIITASSEGISFPG